eukprot:TRINITY_DN7303_c0_g1_i3.p1 TRINITY_DN7303_c0_g1~~TRINITY_DN7303_c0_g1_i3.p1  ORF type:complete len:232 (-),score=-73.43 TRINITY_DN7303_c0_g1_i3:13-708(-)
MLKNISVKIVKNWTNPELFRQLPNNSHNMWNNIQFTYDKNLETDYAIILNFIPKDSEEILKNSKKIWAFMQEPCIDGINKWVETGHENFERIYTHHIFNNESKYIPTQTCLPWHVDKTFDELINLKSIKKTKRISWIVSNLNYLPGHKLRMELHSEVIKQQLPIDIFGKGINPIKDKFNGLASYKYSIAIENSSSPHYWTEKISDCFLSYTVPIYYGCTNIGNYFPKDSFI